MKLQNLLTMLFGTFIVLSCSGFSSPKEQMYPAQQSPQTFIMMPENKEASFSVDFETGALEVTQDTVQTKISLKPILEFNDPYAAPKEKVLIKEKSRVIHISKNVFNADDAIEVLLQGAYIITKNGKTSAFVVDYLLSEVGKVTIVGSTSAGTGQGSRPIFGIIDGEAFYGIYKRIEKGFLYPYQILNAKPHITKGTFTNGTVVFEDNSWDYCALNNISLEKCLQQKKEVIDRYIGPKNTSITVNHSIQYYDYETSEPTTTEERKVKMVSTYHDPYYSTEVKSLIRDLARGNTIKVIPVLLDYVSDDRSLDLPGDDYGNSTVSSVATYTLAEIWNTHPEFFLNYKEKSIFQYEKSKVLLKWWKANKHLYNK